MAGVVCKSGLKADLGALSSDYLPFFCFQWCRRVKLSSAFVAERKCKDLSG